MLAMKPIEPAAYQRNGEPISAEAFYAVACDPRRSVAVEACAGSGKTWMLVSRIVRALLEGADLLTGQVKPHEILAITFTRKAAGEMRERLDGWLKEFAHADDDTLRRELEMRGVKMAEKTGFEDKSGLQPNESGRKQLSNLYRSILACGRPVQIRTFHSWFAALLRGAPVSVLQALNLPVDYQLLEDDAPARALVWRRFYAAVAANASLRSDFEAVVQAHGRFQAGKALQAALDKRVEFALADAQGAVDASVEPFGLRFAQFEGLDSPHAALQGNLARARWLAWAQALGAEQNKTPQKAAQLVVEAFGQDDPATRLALLRKAFFVADEDRLTQHLCKFPAAMEAEPELRALCEARAQHEAWAYQQAMARLTREMIAQFTDLKRERGWVDMNDVERAALVMLGDSTLSGWVQERLDARIRHLMIDEFQDTNPLQWQALYAWLQSYGGAGKAPSVFLVGDPKQSIYRFRRAEPQVFMAAKAFLRDELGGDVLSCDHTRRNAPAVIAAVNTVMSRAVDAGEYDGFRPHTTASGDPGDVVRLPPIDKPDDSGNFSGVPAGAGDSADRGHAATSGQPSANVWRDSLTTPRELPEETRRVLEARQAAAWIAAQVSGGVAPEKIMVLSRRRAGLLPLQDELRALRIPAQIGEKTDLIDCCEVLDIVALLDVLCSPRHDLSLARALRSPLFGLADSRLVELAVLQRDLPLPWFELLQKMEPAGASAPHGAVTGGADTAAGGLAGLGPCLTRWKVWVDTLPPHDALQRIYDDGDVLARFAAAAPPVARSAVLANLRALLAVALELDGGRYSTPYGFVRALKAGGTMAPATPPAQAVRLLTIHGAKGLEADAVLLLDTDTPERAADSMGVLIDWPGEAAAPEKFVFLVSESRPPACAKALLEFEQAAREREELNALYVALTRARRTLAVSSIVPHRDAPGSWWRRLQDVATPIGAPAAPGALPEPAAGEGEFALASLPFLPEALQTPDAAAAAVPNAPENTTDSRVGQAMHRLLEWGGGASAAQRAAVQREFMLGPLEVSRADRMAQRILAGDGAWAWRPDAISYQANEVDLSAGGQLMRLDRLVQRCDAGHEGEWWVLDYKSNHTPQAQPELVAQLQTYRAAVEQIYPGAAVRAAFLTGQGALVEVPRHAT
jgi:ATP-dependent helicase/nuclease subunit A